LDYFNDVFNFSGPASFNPLSLWRSVQLSESDLIKKILICVQLEVE